MRYSIEPRDRMDMDFCYLQKAGKNLSNKYGQKLLDKTSTADATKTASKRAIQKTAEANGDLFGNKIADKITNASKTSLVRLQNDDANNETEVPKKRYISPEQRQQIIDELRLV